MLNRRTTATNNRKAQIRRNHNKACLPSMTGSRNSSSSSLSPFINNTDAILFDTRNHLVCLKQRSYSATAQNHPLLTTNNSDSTNKTTVPNSTTTTNSKLSQNSRTHRSRVERSSLNHSTQKLQPVNSKANNTRTHTIDNRHCSNSKRDSPKLHETYRMMNYIYYLAACCLLTLCALSTPAPFVLAEGSLQSNLQKWKITPEIIGGDPSYMSTIRVELNNGNKVKPGDSVPAKHFKDLNMAKIEWDVSSSDALHTLLLIDLDRKPAVGGNGTQNIYNQYTCLNIPGHFINLGQTIVAFDTPSVPCQPSTKHRILMLAYHQAQTIDISDVAYMSASSGQSRKRENFKLEDFINRHRLEPVAANIILAIGETNGVCSGSGATLHSLQNFSSILIAMVMAVTAFSLLNTRRSLVN